MTDPVATIILPTFDREGTIELTISHALAQTVPVELFIIGDGVPAPRAERLRALAQADERIRYFHHPKHPRRGEPYRDAALTEARGRIICYLCDRDLWLPDHVATMAAMLEQADFCHSLPVHIFPDDEIRTYSTDLAIPIHRRNMLTLWNRVPLSCAAHSLAFYRTLDQGWDDTPEGELTDWHFFKKFLRRADCRCVSGVDPSAITFPTRPRTGWNDERRMAEIADWAARIATDAGRLTTRLAIVGKAVKDRDLLLGQCYGRMLALSRAAQKSQSTGA